MTNTAAAKILLQGLELTLQGKTILHPLHQEIIGRHIAIIGANGSGKTTLLRILGGLQRPSGGTAQLDGINPVTDSKQLRRHVGFLFTNPDAQIVMPTVAEDIAFTLRGSGMPKQAAAELVEHWLRETGLWEHREQPTYSLSGGQKQLLAAASVLIRDPAVILADEPTTMLDLPNQRKISQMLLSQSRPVIIATHDLELAGKCDVAVRFDAGQIVEVGMPDVVIAHYLAAYSEPTETAETAAAVSDDAIRTRNVGKQ